MSKAKKELFLGAFFVAFAIFLYAASYTIILTKADALGPQFFPRMISIFTLILGAIQIFRGAKQLQAEKAAPAVAAPDTRREINWPPIITMAILFLYFLLLKSVGFIILTIIYLIVQIFVLLPKGALRVRRYQIMVPIISIVATLGIYTLFYRVFLIFLPPGILK